MKEDMRSKPRAIFYGVAWLCLGMFVFQWELSTEDIEWWITALGVPAPSAALALAVIRTWPKNVSRETSEPNVASEDAVHGYYARTLDIASGETVACHLMHGAAEPHVEGCVGWSKS